MGSRPDPVRAHAARKTNARIVFRLPPLILFSDDDRLAKMTGERFVTIAAHTLELDPPALCLLPERIVANLPQTGAAPSAFR